MTLRIQLLGVPELTDGDRTPLQRGSKPWLLLAWLLLASRPQSRSHLAGLFCGDADDPMGALRWQLAQLRRMLGPTATVAGDPVVVSLPATALVDVEVLARGRWEEAIELPDLDRPLLAGMTSTGLDARVELWLEAERLRLQGLAAAVVHEASLNALSLDQPALALQYAQRLVEIQPLDEAGHAVLIQCLRADGHEGEAEAQLKRSSQLLRYSGLPPDDTLVRARRGPLPPPAESARLSVQAMIQAGEAAVSAGATAQGLRTLRAAVAMARRQDVGGVLPQALLTLGEALVSIGKGGDQEGGAVLREALRLARGSGGADVAAAAAGALAYADLDRGRYELVHDRVAAAAATGIRDAAQLAWLEAIDGAAFSDQAEYDRAEALLRRALDRADGDSAHRVAVFARAMMGRLAMLRGDLSPAHSLLSRTVRDAETHWFALTAFPQALLAEVQLGLGDLDDARSLAERAYVLGRQVDDPCLEAIATRARGLVAMAQGCPESGLTLLSQAPRFSRRRPDSYLWIEAYALDALCNAALHLGAPAAAGWVAQLEALAARCGMRELSARALLHRARLGDDAANAAARELAESIENPALHRLLQV